MNLLVVFTVFVVTLTVSPLINAQISVNDVLLRRANTLKTQVTTNIDQLKRSGDTQLTLGLTNLNSHIEGVIFYLQHQPNLDPIAKKTVEDELDRLQSRMHEELIALTVVKHHKSKQLTADELIQLCQQLVHEANNVLAHLPKHYNQKEYDAAVLEVKAIEQLVATIHADPGALDKAEEQFVRHEHSLSVLLDRLGP